MPADGAWASVFDFLTERTGLARADLLRQAEVGEVLLGDGTTVGAETAYRPNGVVYLYRALRPEVPVPFELRVLHHDEHIIVVDKPPFLATMPRGSHIVESVVTRLRQDAELADAAPAHRLDRLTAGVLLLTLRPEVRAAYQMMFARGEVAKSYRALAPLRKALAEPVTVSNRIAKPRGQLQASVVPGEGNARSTVQLLSQRAEVGEYVLHPHTGKTHQLRVHCCGLGIPILGDPLYPHVREVAPDDFSDPLQLLAQRLEFEDPLSGESRCFESRRTLGHG
ncbi:MAG: pseudouridine synthase [Ornithinimicrobium sp.]